MRCNRASVHAVHRLTRDTTITMQVVAAPELWLRTALATALMRLAAWILGCSIEVEEA